MSDKDHLTRQDWSPLAQPPGTDGVMAHTPDPTKYFNDRGMLRIPRAAQGENFGASQGEMPTKLNVDPTDASKGTGGLTLDMANLDQDLVKQASAMGHDAITRLEAYQQLMSEKSAMRTLAPKPAPVPAPSLPLAPPPYAAGNPPAAPIISQQPPASPPLPQELQSALAQLVKQSVAEMAPFQSATPPAATEDVVSPLDSFLESIAMPWLTPVPRQPQVAVIFYFPHGKFKTTYHHVDFKEPCLSLIYDNRLENHSQYVPESVRDSAGNLQSIRVDVPSLKLSVLAAVPDLNTTLGCLDIINLIVEPSPPDAQDGVNSLHGHPDLTGG